MNVKFKLCFRVFSGRFSRFDNCMAGMFLVLDTTRRSKASIAVCRDNIDHIAFKWYNVLEEPLDILRRYSLKEKFSSLINSQFFRQVRSVFLMFRFWMFSSAIPRQDVVRCNICVQLFSYGLNCIGGIDLFVVFLSHRITASIRPLFCVSHFTISLCLTPSHNTCFAVEKRCWCARKHQDSPCTTYLRGSLMTE